MEQQNNPRTITGRLLETSYRIGQKVAIDVASGNLPQDQIAITLILRNGLSGLEYALSGYNDQIRSRGKTNIPGR